MLEISRELRKALFLRLPYGGLLVKRGDNPDRPPVNGVTLIEDLGNA